MLLILGFFPAPKRGKPLPQGPCRGRTASIQGLAVFNAIAEDFKAQLTERSRQPIENKNRPFSRTLESRQNTESKQVVWHKAVNMLKGQAVNEFAKGRNTEKPIESSLVRVVPTFKMLRTNPVCH